MKKILVLVFTVLFSFTLQAIEKDSVIRVSEDTAIYNLNATTSYQYIKSDYFALDFHGKDGTILFNRDNTILNSFFRNIYETPQEVFKRKNLKGLAIVAVSTSVLLYFDQDIIDASQQFGRFIGLSQDNNTYDLSPFKGVPLYVPTDLSSGLYYIGDGIAELGVDLGFYIYGGVTGDIRAMRTAVELTEGIATVGVYVQLLKHISGRETPMRATQPGGVWRPLSLKEYHESVPKYDAYPSGHLATAMMTTTIISMNYPEYKFIKPLCYSLMALCGYQMMNNGVHWASDYPLAIAMGYTIGRIAVKNGRSKVETKPFADNKFHPDFELKPVMLGYDAAGLSLSMKF